MTDLSTTTDAQSQETTDGFQLVIDALKLNGIDTIFALPGIPITDLTRRAQADGMRLIAFRHEQNAGHAAAIAGFMTGSFRFRTISSLADPGNHRSILY